MIRFSPTSGTRSATARASLAAYNGSDDIDQLAQMNRPAENDLHDLDVERARRLRLRGQRQNHRTLARQHLGERVGAEPEGTSERLAGAPRRLLAGRGERAGRGGGPACSVEARDSDTTLGWRTVPSS